MESCDTEVVEETGFSLMVEAVLAGVPEHAPVSGDTPLPEFGGKTLDQLRAEFKSGASALFPYLRGGQGPIELDPTGYMKKLMEENL